MLARTFAALCIACWPSVSAAHGWTPRPRPTPVEVAASVSICLTDVTAGGSFTSAGSPDRGVINYQGEPVLFLGREAPPLSAREEGSAHWLDDDPIRERMVLWSDFNIGPDARPLASTEVACFDQEYRHLLRP